MDRVLGRRRSGRRSRRRRPRRRCRRPRRPSRRRASAPRIARTRRPPRARARTAGTRRSGRSEAKMPIASVAELAGEVGIALGHRRADQRADPEARLEHRLPERDPVGDVRGEDDHVGPGGGEVGHHGRPVGQRTGCTRPRMTTGIPSVDGRRLRRVRDGPSRTRRRRPRARPAARDGACRAARRARAAANSDEFAPSVPPVVPTRKTIGRPRPVRRSATAPASQYRSPARSAASLAAIERSDE